MSIDTSVAPTPTPPPVSTSSRSQDPLLSYVSQKVSSLQERYVKDEASAVSSLAKLRRAVTSDPGADPAVWGMTLEGMPESLAGRGDEPTVSEWAAHSAITLFAVHQQSQRKNRMHQSGASVGTAVRRLGLKTANEEAVQRRFHALGTASSRSETLHHLRGLLTQLRAEAIPLDYGLLALDLRRLQDPRSADRVRLAWGRDYHRRGKADDADGSSTTDGQPTNSDTTPGDQR